MHKVKRKAVFLDRDGIINHAVHRNGIVSAPWSMEEFTVIPEVPGFVRELKKLGYFVPVVTNQPDITRGRLAQDELTRIHDFLKSQISVDHVEYCGSVDDTDHRRKPNPGMLLELAERFDLDLARSWIFGDTYRDILAGRAAGVRTILKLTDYNRCDHGMGEFNCETYDAVLEILRS